MDIQIREMMINAMLQRADEQARLVDELRKQNTELQKKLSDLEKSKK